MVNSLNIFIAITFYNPEEIFFEKIKSLSENFKHVFIYDNSELSSVGEKDLVKLNQSLVDYRFNGKNDGVAKALNESVVQALQKNADYILFLDQDSLFGVDDIIQLYNQAEMLKLRDPNAKLFSPNIICEYADENKYLKKTGYEEKEWLITSGCLINLDVFLIAGFFDENLFIDFVDSEFSIRVKALGYKLIQFSSPIMRHELGYSRKIGFYRFYSHSPIRNYYIVRNKLYIERKHKKYFNYFKIMSFLLFYFLRVVFLEDRKSDRIKFLYKAVTDYFSGKMGKIQ